MWKQFVKDYLSFTKKDRVGIIVLAMLIFFVVLLPYIWPARQPRRLSAEEIDKIKSQTAQLKQTANADASPGIKENGPATYHYPVKEYSKEKTELFYFDPNTLDAGGWKRLGIRDRTAATIQKYLARGGVFRKPEDLSKIYGLFKNDYERLLPYVRIKDPLPEEKKNGDEKREYTKAERPVYPVRKNVSFKIIEINGADTTALIPLPGIGSKLAARIINFRDKLGGFYSVEQVAETYGLPDSTFNRIKASLQCNSASVHQININSADANALKQHPYIRWNLANAIVQYRAQHGNFTSIEDLQQIALITPEVFEKIKPYLVVE